jgi:hypothetical protein
MTSSVFDLFAKVEKRHKQPVQTETFNVIYYLLFLRKDPHPHKCHLTFDLSIGCQNNRICCIFGAVYNKTGAKCYNNRPNHTTMRE